MIVFKVNLRRPIDLDRYLSYDINEKKNKETIKYQNMRYKIKTLGDYKNTKT